MDDMYKLIYPADLVVDLACLKIEANLINMK